jgi:hypothetical protein
MEKIRSIRNVLDSNVK